MKTNKNKSIFTFLIVLIFTSVVFTSCNNDDASVESDSVEQSLENVLIQTEINDVNDALDEILEGIAVDFMGSVAFKNELSKATEVQNFLPNCVVVTEETTNEGKTITLDFGDGCTTRNDHILSGKIIINITIDLIEETINIQRVFDNFYFDDKKIEGEVGKFKIKINENGNPEAAIVRNITITWEDGLFVKVNSETTREWIAGFGNRLRDDNVFLITGTSTVINKDGEVITTTIIEPLRREATCKYLVSGIVEIEKADKKITLNYGDGTCDDLAVITIDGQEHEIHLENRRNP